MRDPRQTLQRVLLTLWVLIVAAWLGVVLWLCTGKAMQKPEPVTRYVDRPVEVIREKEVIREVKVPVEVIKEVEKIVKVEVPAKPSARTPVPAVKPPAEFQVYNVTLQITLKEPAAPEAVRKKVAQLREVAVEHGECRSAECVRLQGIWLEGEKVHCADLESK